MSLKKLFIFLFIISTVLLYTDGYRINNVNYDIQGNSFFKFTKTREYPLREAVKIDTDVIFNSFDELLNYINDIEQQLKNQRVIEESKIQYTIDKIDDNQVTLVNLLITTKDTWNIFPLPYPKFDSNDGFIFKLKVKDYNFFGTMRTFNFDLNYAFAQFPNEFDELGNSKSDEHQIGMNFDFELPFKAGPFDTVNTNSGGISFVLGKTMPNFDLSSQIQFTLPFDLFSIIFGFKQSITYEDDYIPTKDQFYFTEKFFISLPFKIYKTKNFDDLILKPYSTITWNWDKDVFTEGFTDCISHEDLSGPTFDLGIELSLGRVNWINNFRTGLTFSVIPYIFYNQHTKLFSPGLTTEIKGFYAFNNFLGINSQLYLYNNINKDIELGNKLRGVIDNLYKTNNSLSLNIDFPIKILKTDWIGWGWTDIKLFKFLKFLDFELQVSPFFDMLISSNPYTNRNFSFKDGWYTCGLELLVFPTKMRSLQVRISYGFDLTTILPESIFNQNSWRPNRSKDEIFFGVGLFY